MEKVTCANCGIENLATNKYCSRCGHELPIIIQPIVQIESTVEPDTFTAKVNRKKGLFGAILGTLLFVLLLLLLKSIFFNGSFLEKFQSSAIEQAMSTMAEQMNKNCPIEVDEYTRLENISALPGKTLQYSYTLSVNKSDVNVDELKEALESQLLSNVKDSPEMQLFRTYKATFIHIYHDQNGVTILEISISPEMYEQ